MIGHDNVVQQRHLRYAREWVTMTRCIHLAITSQLSLMHTKWFPRWYTALIRIHTDNIEVRRNLLLLPQCKRTEFVWWISVEITNNILFTAFHLPLHIATTHSNQPSLDIFLPPSECGRIEKKIRNTTQLPTMVSPPFLPLTKRK